MTITRSIESFLSHFLYFEPFFMLIYQKMCNFAPKVGSKMCAIDEKVGIKTCLYV
jgi:hypothetical protein